MTADAFEMQFFDNSRLSKFKTCPRSYLYAYGIGLRSTGPKFALDFGSSWHDGMDELYLALQRGERNPADLCNAAQIGFSRKWLELGHPSVDEWNLDLDTQYSPRTPMNAFEMYEAYIDRYYAWLCRVKVLSVELPFCVPLWPDNAKIFYVGRLDKIIQDSDGKVYIIEHKTTTATSAGGTAIRADFLESFSPNSQIDGYYHAGVMAHGEAFGGVIVDAALVHRTIHSTFARVPIYKQLDIVLPFLNDTRYWVTRLTEQLQQIGNDKKQWPVEQGYVLDAFPRQTEQCQHKFGNCEFKNICSVDVNPLRHSLAMPQGFIENTWEPFDFNELRQALQLETSHDAASN